MWRTGGAAEIYSYISTTTGYGDEYGKGNFNWRADGQWHTVSETITLNSPGQANGTAALAYDGVTYVNQTGLAITTNATPITGLFFSTFYGGHDTTWSPTSTTHVDFQNFALSGGAIVVPTNTQPPVSTQTPRPTTTPQTTPRLTASPTPRPAPSPSPVPSSSPPILPTPVSVSVSGSTITGQLVGKADKCLDNDHSHARNGNKIQLYKCNGTDAQKLTITLTGAGPISYANGYCLTTEPSTLITDKSKVHMVVDLFQCNNSSNQQWVYDQNLTTFTNPASGLCLDDKWSASKDGNQIWAYTCNDTHAQKWIIPQLLNSD
jgi:hypothetical protein